MDCKSEIKDIHYEVFCEVLYEVYYGVHKLIQYCVLYTYDKRRRLLRYQNRKKYIKVITPDRG